MEYMRMLKGLLPGLGVVLVSRIANLETISTARKAGADYYLTKGSFHDETLVNAVTDLIGPP